MPLTLDVALKPNLEVFGPELRAQMARELLETAYALLHMDDNLTYVHIEQAISEL